MRSVDPDSLSAHHVSWWAELSVGASFTGATFNVLVTARLVPPSPSVSRANNVRGDATGFSDSWVYTMLRNDNVKVLTSLNKLPTGNNLHVWIVTQRVSDESLLTLKELDVTQSAISDAGIEELATALTETKVNRREAQ